MPVRFRSTRAFKLDAHSRVFGGLKCLTIRRVRRPLTNSALLPSRPPQAVQDHSLRFRRHFHFRHVGRRRRRAQALDVQRLPKGGFVDGDRFPNLRTVALHHRHGPHAALGAGSNFAAPSSWDIPRE